jgi:hypothetical protein
VIRLRTEIPDVPDLDEALRRELAAAARRGQVRLVDEARRRAPTATGALRRSIAAGPVRWEGETLTAEVLAGGVGAPYAAAVEYGTGTRSTAPDSPRRPIVIVPMRRKALAWPRPELGPPGGPARRLSGALRTHLQRALAEGRMRATEVYVFARRVVQMGQAPRPYLAPALEAVVEAILDDLADAVERAWSGGQ